MQIYGSGLKGYANTAQVDDAGHVYTISTLSGVPQVVSSGVVHDFTTQLIQRIDYGDEMQPVYMGLALPGTNVGSVGWQIRKNTFSGTMPKMIIAVLFGSGTTAFTGNWSERSGTSEVYL